MFIYFANKSNIISLSGNIFHMFKSEKVCNFVFSLSTHPKKKNEFPLAFPSMKIINNNALIDKYHNSIYMLAFPPFCVFKLNKHYQYFRPASLFRCYAYARKRFEPNQQLFSSPEVNNNVRNKIETIVKSSSKQQNPNSIADRKLFAKPFSSCHLNEILSAHL